LCVLATIATLSMVISADEKRGTLAISVMPKPGESEAFPFPPYRRPIQY